MMSIRDATTAWKGKALLVFFITAQTQPSTGRVFPKVKQAVPGHSGYMSQGSGSVGRVRAKSSWDVTANTVLLHC